uniref:MULE transposase domain-containing protein n=1 Tax=Lactuca sativa TaxID=4236 RepID=A0A9R1WWC4_LACSA|nr:hypothetical protein LSAT_V11C800389760 [Lactuca sativa]
MHNRVKYLPNIVTTLDTNPTSSTSTNESYCSNIIEESDYKPYAPSEFVPVVNNVFKSLNLAIKIYTDYAQMTCFSYKTEGGKDKPKHCDTLVTGFVKRKSNSNKIITRCTTKIIFENVYGTTYYKVNEFFELHNHPLKIIEDISYIKKARKMSYSKKDFVLHASTSKLGPMMAHKMRVVLKGGYEYLAAMFWTDKREKAFYIEFGEVISFDATFKTNKYKMVFVPFTTIDHHKKSVTVGIETIESYEWLLKAFLRAHE